MLAKLAFATGLFVVPIVLLSVGHTLRKRSPQQRAAFWGATYGYLGAVTLTCVLTVAPPIDWNGGSLVRDVAIHWSMLLAAMVGAVIGGAGRKQQADAAGAVKRRTGVEV
jgi:uncharacterized membrane protein YdcZ (DUF606 family)